MATKNSRANTLVVTLILMSTLMALVGVAVTYTQGTARTAKRIQTRVSAQSIAEGCLDLAFSSWRQMSRNTFSAGPNLKDYYGANTVYKVSPPSTDTIALGIKMPSAAMFPDVPGFTATSANDPSFTVSNYKVQAVDPLLSMTSTDPPVSGAVTNREANSFEWVTGGAGFFNNGRRSFIYLASADVTLPTPAGRVTTKMRRLFEKKITQPTRYFLFYNDDLELHPNATSPLTIYGGVHTNGKLYTGTSALTFNSVLPVLGISMASLYPTPSLGVTYADDWVIGYKPGDNVVRGAAAPPVLAAKTPVTRGPNWQLWGWDPNQFNAIDANQNNDSPHEILEKQVTPVGTHPDPLSTATARKWTYAPANLDTQRLDPSAGVRIEIDASNVVRIYDQTGRLLNATSTGPDATGATPPNAMEFGYGYLHNMWMAALGANNSWTILAAKKVTGGSTTNGSNILNAGPGSFTAADAGRPISAPGIPVGTYILTFTNATQVKLTRNATATVPSGLPVTVGGFFQMQDNREGGPVDVYTIDWQVFKMWDPHTSSAAGPAPYIAATTPPATPNPKRLQTGMFGAGGPTYMTLFPVAGKKRAFRIKNAGKLNQWNPDPSAGFNNQSGPPQIQPLITNNPLYIQGDFNSGRNAIATPNNPVNTTTIPACNNGGPLTHVASTVFGGENYYQADVRIYADAITVLSNDWNDDNHSLGLGSRIASNTTVNACMHTGNVPTSATNGYSGGGENLIRLLEDWTGKYFTIHGALIQLFQSKEATGIWGKANVYVEPKPAGSPAVGGRNWYYNPVHGAGVQFDGVYVMAYVRHKWSPTPWTATPGP